MAIRKSIEEKYVVTGSLESWLKKCEMALNNGNFTGVKVNKVLNQITGNYKKMFVWGEISLTLSEEGDKVSIRAVSTANTDNVFALFSSPNGKILCQFKDNLN